MEIWPKNLCGKVRGLRDNGACHTAGKVFDNQIVYQLAHVAARRDG